MGNFGPVHSRHGLEEQKLEVKNAYWNLPPAQLYEHAIRRGEGVISAGGPLVARTGEHTGRSPKDKFTVEEPSRSARASSTTRPKAASRTRTWRPPSRPAGLRLCPRRPPPTTTMPA